MGECIKVKRDEYVCIPIVQMFSNVREANSKATQGTYLRCFWCAYFWFYLQVPKDNLGKESLQPNLLMASIISPVRSHRSKVIMFADLRAYFGVFKIVYTKATPIRLIVAIN